MAEHPGRRVDPSIEPLQYQQGDYSLRGERLWFCTPNGHVAQVPVARGPQTDRAWGMEEHPDGSLTIHPSIKLLTPRHNSDGTVMRDAQGQVVEDELWHGHLTGGVWKGAAPF